MIQPREYLRASMSHLSTPKGEHWMDKGTALCSEVDPAIFFPDQGDWVATQRAKAICAVCPLREDCRKEALDNSEMWGTWGGLSERDRRDERNPGEACGKGHDLTLPNARLTRGGCRQCNRDRQRIYDEGRSPRRREEAS